MAVIQRSSFQAGKERNMHLDENALLVLRKRYLLLARLVRGGKIDWG